MSNATKIICDVMGTRNASRASYDRTLRATYEASLRATMRDQADRFDDACDILAELDADDPHSELIVSWRREALTEWVAAFRRLCVLRRSHLRVVTR